MADKLVRLCWNSNLWRKPSGPENKSTNKQSYECEHGFGLEEWLFDTSKEIDGYHYGFIQIRGNAKNNFIHAKETHDVAFYTIFEKDKFLVAEISSLIFIDKKESDKIWKEYTNRGWDKQMLDQLSKAGINKNKIKLKDLREFNVKFKKENLKFYDTEQRSFINVSPMRYILRDMSGSEEIRKTLIPGNHNFEDSPTKRQNKKSVTEVERLHKTIQKDLFEQLNQKYPGKVGAEQHGIDLFVEEKGEYILYEVKTNPDVRHCIREAMGQLLEYAYASTYFKDKEEMKIKSLVIVSPHDLTKEMENYLNYLKERVKLPLTYEKYEKSLPQENK